MLELVLDTNVLVAGLRSKGGASYQLLRMVGGGRFRLNISVALALEYEDVLKRPGLISGLSESDVDALIDYLAATANLVPSVTQLRPSLRDPDDERILKLAVQSNAVIVTHNTRDFHGALKFGVAVKTPKEVLEMLESAT